MLCQDAQDAAAREREALFASRARLGHGLPYIYLEVLRVEERRRAWPGRRCPHSPARLFRARGTKSARARLASDSEKALKVPLQPGHALPSLLGREGFVDQPGGLLGREHADVILVELAVDPERLRDHQHRVRLGPVLALAVEFREEVCGWIARRSRAGT